MDEFDKLVNKLAGKNTSKKSEMDYMEKNIKHSINIECKKGISLFFCSVWADGSNLA